MLAVSEKIRLPSDVDIERSDIERSIPNQSSIGNKSQYQIYCLDVDKIVRLNLKS